MYVVYVCIYCIYCILCILYVCSIIILDTAFKFDLELSLLFRIIVSMETTSNISDFLTTLHVVGIPGEGINDERYLSRVKEIRKKIKYLMYSRDVSEPLPSDEQEKIEKILESIGIWSVEWMVDVWPSIGGDGVDVDFLIQMGGYVVVSLSDKGISYLNKIDKEVSLSSHVTTVTV